MHIAGGGSPRCYDCLEYKGKRGGAKKTREDRHKTNSPLMLVSADFFGKISPKSIRGNQWVFVFICDECSFAHCEPLAQKSDAPDALARFTTMIRQKCGTINGRTGTSYCSIRPANERDMRALYLKH